MNRLKVILAAFVAWQAIHAATLTLHNGWQVQSSEELRMHGHTLAERLTGNVLSTMEADVSGWYAATVPSTVMGVLTANGVEPEALTAADYQRIDKKRFDASWWYRTTFKLQPSEEHVLLTFDGISNRANIWLNGHLVAGKDEVAGAYRQFTFDVTPYVREENVLAVEVFRAQPGEPNIGFVDWNPRPADESMGIFREVRVKTCGNVSLCHSAVRSKVNKETLQEAWLTIETEVENLTDKRVQGIVCGTVDEGRTFTTPVTLAPHERRRVRLAQDARIEHPRLWWCHTMGKPELYGLQVAFTENQHVTDSEQIRFGIREVGSYLTPEGHRGFTLNGRNVLIRGAGWTDDIYLRDTPERNRQQLEYVCDMNMNTVRLEGFWGTSHSLYDLCDELGLLVLVGWSCHWEWEEYLGAPCDPNHGGITSEENIALIGQSFEDQVLWLRHHPSIIAWYVGSDRLPVPALEQRYQTTLAASDDRPCITSAKGLTSTVSGPSGMKMEGPYDYVSPSYWYDPLAPGGAFGFNTETGIGAQLPVRESLQRMLGGALFPVDNRWNILCTASTSEMNTPLKLTEVITARFGETPTRDEYLHRADLLSYESTRAMFEAFRVNACPTLADGSVNRHRATGIIQWMLNSARPGIYWQLYDYYLQPNAAYYAVKRANQPVQLIYDYQRRAVFAVNETLQSVTLNAEMRIIGGTMLATPHSDHRSENEERGTRNEEGGTMLTVGPGQVVKAFDIPAQGEADAFLFLKATDPAGNEIAVNDYFLPAERDTYDWTKTNWVTTPISHYASYRSLISLPRVTCQLTSERNNGQLFELTLTNPSSTVAFFQRLIVKDAQGALVCPAYWSDNYVTLAPSETRTITCVLPEQDHQSEIHFEIESF